MNFTLFKAVGPLFASSWEDRSTPAKGNVEFDPLKIETGNAAI